MKLSKDPPLELLASAQTLTRTKQKLVVINAMLAVIKDRLDKMEKMATSDNPSSGFADVLGFFGKILSSNPATTTTTTSVTATTPITTQTSKTSISNENHNQQDQDQSNQQSQQTNQTPDQQSQQPTGQQL